MVLSGVDHVHGQPRPDQAPALPGNGVRLCDVLPVPQDLRAQMQSYTCTLVTIASCCSDVYLSYRKISWHRNRASFSNEKVLIAREIS